MINAFANISNYLYTIAFVALSFSVIPAFGQTYKNEVGVTSENDVYLAFLQDRYYTDGTFFHYRHAVDKDKINPGLKKIISELEIGQKIYTPYSAKLSDASLHDRPFAGYLYAGFASNRFYENENVIRFKVEIGTIGPAAKGKEFQSGFHKMFGIYKVRGWEHQLKNEMGLNLSFDYKNMLLRSKSGHADMTFISTALLGNTFSGLNAGAMFRFGKVNRLYESVSSNSLLSNDASQKKIHGEFFLFAKPQMRYVAYDATIQGGLFRKDKGPVTFGIKNFVYLLQTGVGFSAGRWSGDYTAIFCGREVESTAVAYRYGSASLYYRFNW